MKKTVLAASFLLLAALVAAWFFGRPAYHRYKERRAVVQAKQFLQRGDFRNASLSARQALLANPQSLDASRMMAALADLAQSTNALEWHRRIAETDPSADNKLRLVAAALRYQAPPFPLASETLAELASVASNTAPFHVLSAERAMKLRNVPEAIYHFEQAERLEPSNQTHQLNLAVLNLHSTNRATAEAARHSLSSLRDSTNLGPVALRWLISEAAAKVQTNSSPASGSNSNLAYLVGLASELVAKPGATTEDRLQHLAILKKAGGPGFADAFARAQDFARTNATELYALSVWMITQGMATNALSWLETCPSDILAKQPVPMAFVDCYVATTNWDGLESFLLDKKWDQLDFMRLAFLSRAAAEKGRSQAAEVRWRSAVREAGDRLGALSSLLSMANAWNRRTELEELLWHVANRFPRERWALRELDRLYSGSGNTLGLNKTAALAMAFEPTNHVARNNYAATSLLLRLNLTRAHQTALDNYRVHPEEPVVVSTYAYSLLLQDKTSDALAAIEKLKPADLQQPAIALYYAVLLAATGQTNRAAPYFDHARVAGNNFLPEEQALLAANPQPHPR